MINSPIQEDSRMLTLRKRLKRPGSQNYRSRAGVMRGIVWPCHFRLICLAFPLFGTIAAAVYKSSLCCVLSVNSMQRLQPKTIFLLGRINRQFYAKAVLYPISIIQYIKPQCIFLMLY